MTTKEMLERIKDDPRTTAAAYIIGAVLAAGEYLHQAGIEPWGAMMIGLGGFSACGCLLFARFSPRKDLEPYDPDKTPPFGLRR